MLGKVDIERHKELLRLVKLEYLIDSKKRLGLFFRNETTPWDCDGVILTRNFYY